MGAVLHHKGGTKYPWEVTVTIGNQEARIRFLRLSLLPDVLFDGDIKFVSSANFFGANLEAPCTMTFGFKEEATAMQFFLENS